MHQRRPYNVPPSFVMLPPEYKGLKLGEILQRAVKERNPHRQRTVIQWLSEVLRFQMGMSYDNTIDWCKRHGVSRDQWEDLVQ